VTSDDGSTIPLILGFLLIALMIVAGSVAAGDAFVQQTNLQSRCDGAAAAAASSVDGDAQRASSTTTALRLTEVQRAVRRYLDRESDGATIGASAELSADTSTVSVTCVRREALAFGSLFGFGDGIRHRATSSARSPESS
jgi:uncharacterized membrane protein